MKTIEEEFPESFTAGEPSYNLLRSWYSDLRARAVEMERAQRWRPIAEAPRDSTPVDLWGLASGDGMLPITKHRRFCNCEYIPPTSTWNAERWFSTSHGDIKPTHFRPIPPAPEIHQQTQ